MTGSIVAVGILGCIIIREVNLMRASPIAEESAASAIRRASVELSTTAYHHVRSQVPLEVSLGTRLL
jgi:hypothetical protein